MSKVKSKPTLVNRLSESDPEQAFRRGFSCVGWQHLTWIERPALHEAELRKVTYLVATAKWQAKRAVKVPLGWFGLDLCKKRDETFELRFLKAYNIKTVLDVGANEGQFARVVRRILPEATIHSFEPVSQCFDALTRLASEDRRLFAHKVALGAEELQTQIHVNAFTPASSLLSTAPTLVEKWPHTAKTSTQPVKVITLDSWASQRRLERPILIKLDVQGYEGQVIQGGAETLQATDVMIAEISFFELYQGQTRFDELYTTLTRAGFQFAGTIGNMCDAASRILASDAVFIRGQDSR